MIQALERVCRRWLVGLAWLGLLGAGAAQAQLTEANVEALLVALEAADERRDSGFVMEALAEDVVILFRFSAMGNVPDMRFNKAQYKEYLTEAYAALQDHSSRRYGTRITISDDGSQAEVFANVEETTTMQGKTTSHVSQQYVLVTWENDRPRIKRVFAELLDQGSDT